MITALCSDQVFTGDQTLPGHAVLIDGATIRDIVPNAAVTGDMRRVDFGARWLVPGFIDVQVNGGGGVLFNDAPTVGTMRRMVSAHAAFGTTAMLPTLISDTEDNVVAAAAAVATAVAAGETGIAGVHFEGPYLNPVRKGAHAAAHFRAPVAAECGHLTPPPGGVSLVTLAPETVPTGTIRSFAETGIIVSAGHTDATAADIAAACAEGLRGFTHVFNAMSPMAARAPGVVGAALADPGTWCTVIADGHHVDPACLRIALAAKPRGRVILITDAMSTVGATTTTQFTLTGQTVTERDGRLTLEDGTLAGSALDMATAVRNAVNLLGQSVEEAVRMATVYPAEYLRLHATHGHLRPGMRADLTCLNEDLTCHSTWIGGMPVSGGAA